MRPAHIRPEAPQTMRSRCPGERSGTRRAGRKGITTERSNINSHSCKSASGRWGKCLLGYSLIVVFYAANLQTNEEIWPESRALRNKKGARLFRRRVFVHPVNQYE